MDTYRAKIHGKVAIVTGAASGFGKLLSEKLVGYGARVLLVDINPLVEQISTQLNEQSNEATTWTVCDLCQIQSIQECFDLALHHFGQVDILVNNAGIANERSLFSQPDHTELDQIVKTNLVAPMEATRIAVRYFRETKRPGIIVNTASVGGLMPISLMESYGSTKAGLIFFTATCRSLAPQIRVNAVAPYFADTSLVAHNRLVNSYPLVQQIGLMHPGKVVKTMLQTICDDSLAGDTLMVAMGNEPQKLTFYHDLTMQVTLYITRGTVNKYASLVNKFFSRMLDSTLSALRKKIPPQDRVRFG